MPTKNASVVSQDTPKGGMKKRQQIDHSSRTMFAWVVGASVIVAFAIVASIFIMQKIIFNEKVLAAKGETASKLSEKITAAKELIRTVNRLRGDRTLGQIQGVNQKSNNLDKIFAALPYDNDEIAVGSSLESTLLTGLNVESLSVGSQTGDAASAEATVAPAGAETNAQPIPFSFKATGTEDQLKELFGKLNRSIRPMQINILQLEAAGAGRLTATVTASTFYQSPTQFELIKRTIK